MLLSSQEFEEQSEPGKSSIEKVYQDKTLIPGPIFSLANTKAARLYCQRFSKKQNGATCIVIQDESFLRIWNEFYLNKLKPKRTNSSRPTKNSTKYLPVESEFVSNCQNKLSIILGPVAGVICKKALAKKPNLTREQFVIIIAKKISDPEKARQFQQELLAE